MRPTQIAGLAVGLSSITLLLSLAFFGWRFAHRRTRHNPRHPTIPSISVESRNSKRSRRSGEKRSKGDITQLTTFTGTANSTKSKGFLGDDEIDIEEGDGEMEMDPLDASIEIAKPSTSPSPFLLCLIRLLITIDSSPPFGRVG
jgi:hypothetical protein